PAGPPPITSTSVPETSGAAGAAALPAASGWTRFVVILNTGRCLAGLAEHDSGCTRGPVARGRAMLDRCSPARRESPPAPCPTERKPDGPANRRRTRTGPAAGRKPEPGGGRTRFDRSRSAAVQPRPGPGFDRRARAGAGDQQALRLPAALGQRR